MPVVLEDSKSRIATDPLRNFKFSVVISPIVRDLKNANEITFGGVGFMSVAGFTMNTEVIPYREGGNNTTTRKMPGQTDFSPITLSRGVTLGRGSRSMFNWMKTIFFVQHGEGTKGQGANPNFRTNFVVHVLEHPVTRFGTAGVQSKLKFKVYNAWPSTLTYSDLDAGGNAVMIQTIVLQHEGWKVASGTVDEPARF